MCSGFPLVGELSRSPCWRPRADDWYEHPISDRVFAELNRRLQEVLQESDKGLIVGPFEAHRFKAVGIHSRGDGSKLLPVALGAAYAAFAFSVVQEGSDGHKTTRRCEDYRRSHHNDTVRAYDKPPHNAVVTYVRVIRVWSALHEDVQVWCQDMLSAYRLI